MAAERIRRFLAEHDVEYDSQTHDRAVPSQRIAATEHISGWEIAKPVMLIAEGELIMAVIPAPAYVDLERASQAFAGEVRLAREDEFVDRFPDCEPGAEPPFGALYDIPVYADPILQEDEHLTFRAGTHDTTMRMRTEDWLAVEQPVLLELATLPERMLT